MILSRLFIIPQIISVNSASVVAVFPLPDKCNAKSDSQKFMLFGLDAYHKGCF